MASSTAEYIKEQLKESAAVKVVCAEKMAAEIERAAVTITKTIRSGGKVMLCGNGGSAADSQHLATEMVVRLSGKLDRPPLPAIALTTDTSTLTAAGNDFGFEMIFSRQVEALGKAGDILVAISTSGNSANVVKAVETARKMNIFCVGFLGKDGGKIKNLVDIPLCVPSTDVQRIQEVHITLGHIIIAIVEKELFER